MFDLAKHLAILNKDLAVGGTLTVAAAAGVEELDASEIAALGLMCVAEQAELRPRAVDGIEKAVKPHLHAMPVAVGGKDANTAKLNEKRVRHTSRFPVTVAGDVLQRDIGIARRHGSSVLRPVAQMNDMIGLIRLNGAAHIGSVAMGIRKNRDFHGLDGTFLRVVT